MLVSFNKYNPCKLQKQVLLVKTRFCIKYIINYHSLLFRKQFFRTLLNHLNQFYQKFDTNAEYDKFYINKFVLSFYSTNSAGFYSKKQLLK